MIEVQCTSCQTRYRIDERILPDETPTFKCSRCGHVFTIEPRKRTPRRPGAERARPAPSAPATDADAPAADAGPAAPASDAEPPSSAAADAGAEAPASAAAAPSPSPQPPAGAADAAPGGPAAPSPRPRPALRRAPKPPAGAQGGQPAPQQQTSVDTAHEAGGGGGAGGGPPPPPERDEPRAETQAAEADAAAASAKADAAAASAPSGPAVGDASAHDDASSSAREAERPAPTRSPTEELVGRRFEPAPEEDDRHSRNLSFDFSDEVRTPVDESDRPAEDYRDEAWEVGEPAAAPPLRAPRRIRADDIDDAREGRDFEPLSHEEASAAAARLELELRGRSYTLHSAGFFIALFALVVFGFGVLSMVICGAPVASAELLSALPMVGAELEPPISPARRVALSQVEARYTTIKGKQTALVISGVAENVSPAALGTVQIEAALTDPAQQPLRARAVYCGNNLSPAMVGEMTPHELDFFEKLGAPANFSLAPQASTPFVIVFVAPPAGANRFQLRIAKAEPSAAAAPAPAAD